MKEAFIEAYDENADALFRHCFFKVGDRETSLDLVQETFLKSWNYVSGGNEISNLKAFLYKTLNNLIIDYYRKKKSLSLDALSDDGYEPRFEDSSTVEDKIDGVKALELLRHLPDQYREAVFMRYVNNLEISEIADITGETENTVSVHVHRGLKKLKELFQNGK